MSEVLIAERRKTHGDWQRQAELAQQLKAAIAMAVAQRPECTAMLLSPQQCEAIQAICTKLARIALGDPRHADHWRDIAGYATLGIENDAEVEDIKS